MGAQHSKFYHPYKHYHIIPVNTDLKPICKPGYPFFDQLKRDLLQKKVGYLRGVKIKPAENSAKSSAVSTKDSRNSSSTLLSRLPSLTRPKSDLKEAVFNRTQQKPLINEAKSKDGESKRSLSICQKRDIFSPPKKTVFEPIPVANSVETGTLMIATSRKYSRPCQQKQPAMFVRQQVFNPANSVPTVEMLPSFRNVLVSDSKLIELPMLLSLYSRQPFKPTTLDSLPSQVKSFSRFRTILANVNNTPLVNQPEHGTEHLNN